MEISARELGRRAGVEQSLLSRWLSGERPLPEKHLAAVDRVTAAGTRGEARHPVYILAIVGEPSFGWAPLLDSRGRVGYTEVERADLARHVGELMRRLGWGGLEAVPVWPSWLKDRKIVQLDRQIANANRGKTQEEVAKVAASEILGFLTSAKAAGDRNAGKVNKGTAKT